MFSVLETRVSDRMFGRVWAIGVETMPGLKLVAEKHKMRYINIKGADEV